MTGLLIISAIVIAVAMLIMAVGVIFNKRSLRGSCGGSEIFDCDGDPVACGACPNRQQKGNAADGGRRTASPAEMVRELLAK